MTLKLSGEGSLEVRDVSESLVSSFLGTLYSLLFAICLAKQERATYYTVAYTVYSVVAFDLALGGGSM
jgi:hypothetical protein